MVFYILRLILFICSTLVLKLLAEVTFDIQMLEAEHFKLLLS